jgi:hypothetical protein
MTEYREEVAGEHCRLFADIGKDGWSDPEVVE